MVLPPSAPPETPGPKDGKKRVGCRQGRVLGFRVWGLGDFKQYSTNMDGTSRYHVDQIMLCCSRLGTTHSADSGIRTT